MKVSDIPLSVIFISVWFPGYVLNETGPEQRIKVGFWIWSLNVRSDFPEDPDSCYGLWNTLKARKLQK